MSDFGDDMRAWREHKQEMRAKMPECPVCAVRYGTGTKNPAGVPCRNCGWVDPALACKCDDCGRHFKAPQSLADHRRNKHSTAV